MTGCRFDLFLALLFLTASISGPLFAEKRLPGSSKTLMEKHKSHLQNLESEIKEKQDELKSLSSQETSITLTLDQLDRRIDSARTKQSQLIAERDRVHSELQVKAVSVDQLSREVDALKSNTRERLRALYKLGDLGYMRLLLASDDWQDLVGTSRWIKRVMTQDLSQLQAAQNQIATFSQQKTELGEKQATLEALRLRLHEQDREISAQRQQQKRLLSMTQSQRTLYQKSVQELKQSATQLQALIDRLTREGFRSNFATMKGALPLPVDGKIVARFGKHVDRRLKTINQRNGIDIEVKSGQEVRAIHYGKVIYSGWFTGYGKIVIVDHGNYFYSMSAHLARVDQKEGNKVEAGEKLGLAGETGSLKGPYLYFELRERGLAVDPLPWFSRDFMPKENG